jgi:phosphatidylglycerol---prolipoprotein diacylglyceryl transferase
MHQICFEIGSFSIRWYGVMVALGFMSAMFVLNYRRGYGGLNSDQTANLSLLAIFGGLLGARLFYVVQFWSKFKHQPMEIIRIDHGGLVFYGGFIVTACLFIWYCRKHKLNMLSVLDITGPAVALGHAFGRIGCILNGCCFGKPTEFFMAVTYPHGVLPDRFDYGAARHPVQLYETFGNLIIFGVLFYLVGKLKRGRVTALYLILYGILRFVDEFFRGDHTDKILDTFTRAQFIGLFLIPIGIILYIKCAKNERLEKIEPDSSAGTEEKAA